MTLRSVAACQSRMVWQSNVEAIRIVASKPSGLNARKGRDKQSLPSRSPVAMMG